MKRLTRSIYFIFYPIFFSIIFSNCAPQYFPNAVNVPMLKEKGELQLGVGFGTLGGDAQVSYAATDHVGFMLNGSIEDYKDEGKTYRKHKFIEAGVGYFGTFKERYKYDFYGGYGLGGGKSYTPGLGLFLGSRSSDVNYERYFFQPSIGFREKNVSISFATKFAYVDITDRRAPKRVLYGFFIEPALTTRIGWKNIKLSFQGGLSFNTSEDLDHNPLLFSIGIHTNFNVFQKKNIH